jgi:hypothetical protein
MAFYRGEGGAGTGDVTTEPFPIGVGGTGATTAAGARANLGVTGTGEDTAYAFRSNNLSDLVSASTARTNLGLGTAATTSASDYATAAQGLLADSATQPGDLATVATSGDYDDLTNKPSLATVATSGDYDDLTNKPSIPASLTDLGIVDGTNGQTLTTDGAGNFSFSNAGVGTVTSVAASVPTGLTVSGSPITSSGTLAITYDTGYAIPTTAKQTEWDTAYGWGDHSTEGYLTSYTETDPVVGAITGIVKADGAGNITAAVAGTDYLVSETYTGTVTSVAATVPTGFTVSGSPVTSSGTIAISFDTGYALPTTAKQTEWDTAYGWGNHASAGYLTTETYTGTVTSVAASVPTGLVVSGSPITSSGTLAITYDTGYSIPTTSSQSNWDTAYGWGDHASAGYLDSADIGVTVQGYDATTLKSADIGVTVQGYDADTAKYDAVTANFTGTLQQNGVNVLTTASTIEGGTYS